MKRYYISHPFTGNEEKNKADADLIRAALKISYPNICFINPLGMFGDKNTDYCTALADALELLSACEAVIFCPGWEESTGCRAEKAFAIQQGIKIMYLEDFYDALRHLTDEDVKDDFLKRSIISKAIKAQQKEVGRGMAALFRVVNYTQKQTSTS